MADLSTSYNPAFIASASDAASSALVLGGSNASAVAAASSAIAARIDQSVKSAASPTFAGLDLTSITDGYIPYVGAGALAESPIFTDGTDIGIGTADPSQELDLIGDLELENTTSADTGVIYKDSNRFIHNFQHPTGNTAVPVGCNTFIGVNAGNFTMGSTATATKHGSTNVGIGYGILQANTSGYSNSAMGYQVLNFNNTGYDNSAIGYQSLFNNTTGYRNSAIGYQVLCYNQTGNYNTVMGYQADGFGAGAANSHSNNTAIGSYAGYNVTTGSNNIFLGYKAGENLTTGIKNIVIGYDINAPASNSTNTLNIGNLIYATGLDGSDGTLSTGNVGIGETAPDEKLEVNGNIHLTGIAYFSSEIDNGDSGTADTIDWTAGNKQKSTLTNDCTFTFSPEPSGPCNLLLKLIQDGTGGRTVTWPGDVYWPSGTAPTLSTGIGAVDIVCFYYDGTNFYGNVSLNFSVPA